MLQVSGYTIIGDRPYQQDAFQYQRHPQGHLLCSVCDGMGGMEGGERASAAAIRSMFRQYQLSPPKNVSTSDAWLREALIQADQEVHHLTRPDGTTLYSGSTCVVFLADETCFTWGSVGDSRIYFLRDGILHILTRMHNYNLQLDAMLAKGEIDQEQRKSMASRGEALISYLGLGTLPVLDTGKSPIAWKEEDIVILCSDGIYKSLEDLQVQAIVEESGGNVQLMASRLCEEAYRLAVKKQDNTTAIAIRYAKERGHA